MVILMGAATVQAQPTEWEKTFTVEAVQAHFDGDRVLVVAAGDESLSGPASDAALTALRGVPVALAMDSASLGDVASLSDREIVERAASLPVDEVWVIRAFAGGDKPDTVVAVGYDLEGNVVRALNGLRGIPLGQATDPAAVRATKGLSPSVAASVASVTDGGDGAHARAVTQYEEQYLHFGLSAIVNAGTGTVLSTSDYPVQGKYGKKLSWKEFYEAAERPDLLSDYKRRVRRKRLVATSGFLFVALGVALLPISFKTGPCDTDFTSFCLPDVRVGMVTAGSIFLAGGTGTALAGLFMRKDKVPSDEKRRAADQHNAELRRRLGLNDDLSPAPEGPQPVAHRAARPGRLGAPMIVPSASRRTAGLTAAWRF